MMLYDNWEFIHETSTVKILTGAILVGIGLVTLPLPTGSIFLIAVGAALMSAGGVDLLTLKKTIYWKVITRLKIRSNR